MLSLLVGRLLQPPSLLSLISVQPHRVGEGTHETGNENRDKTCVSTDLPISRQLNACLAKLGVADCLQDPLKSTLQAWRRTLGCPTSFYQRVSQTNIQVVGRRGKSQPSHYQLDKLQNQAFSQTIHKSGGTVATKNSQVRQHSSVETRRPSELCQSA